MQVEKRNGQLEEVSFDKVIKRLRWLGEMTPPCQNIEPISISQKVISRIYNKVKTSELDELAARICTSMITEHPDYGVLASRIIISNNHKNTSPSFTETIYRLYHNKDKYRNPVPLISEEVYAIIMENGSKLNSVIDCKRDYLFDYFGFKTLEKAYLMKIGNKHDGYTIVERIQYMIMRVSIGLHKSDIKAAIETYNLMSLKYFTHATPTLFHAGTPRPQLLSCFLMGVSDSVAGIYNALSDCAKISKWAGGIGIHISNIRARNSMIRSTNGISSGIVPMLRVFNDTARYINQSGKRNGSFAIYIEPWHADIQDFLELKKNHGDEDARARDLFYALWIPDLFMQRVQNNEMWSLFCPDEARGLADTHGGEFNDLYLRYEKEGRYRTQIKARELWQSIIVSQIETGNPYILYKDSVNSKTNQSNLGMIKSSNLCTEIMEYSDASQYACCTLASIGLPTMLDDPVFPKSHPKLRVFTKEGCQYCRMVKMLCKQWNITYEEIDLTEESLRRSTIAKLEVELNQKITTLPQIWISGTDTDTYLGGYSELEDRLRPVFNFQKLYEVTKVIAQNLDKIIDLNFYPVPETRYSNRLHRPMGIGVQGLADVYCAMRYAFDSDSADLLNKQIFATIYYASMEKSMELSKERQGPLLRIQELRRELSEQHVYFKQLYQQELVTAKDCRRIEPNNPANDDVIWLRGSGTQIETDQFIAQVPVELRDVLVKQVEELQLLENRWKPIDEELKRPLTEVGNNQQYLGTYSSYHNSPISRGKFQFNLWNKDPLDEVPGLKLDWSNLRQEIRKYGVRNSLMLAPMPTASTSQILGNNECIEPYTTNIYTRRTIAGDFIVLNKFLLNDLINLGIWDEELKNTIIHFNGSIKNIDTIPSHVREMYKTTWEISQKTLIDKAADRGIYICQSQSLNLFIEKPSINKVSSMHFYSWKKGLKTGIYYLRTRAVVDAQKFTIEPALKDKITQFMGKQQEACESCSA